MKPMTRYKAKWGKCFRPFFYIDQGFYFIPPAYVEWINLLVPASRFSHKREYPKPYFGRYPFRVKVVSEFLSVGR